MWAASHGVIVPIGQLMRMSKIPIPELRRLKEFLESLSAF